MKYLIILSLFLFACKKAEKQPDQLDLLIEDYKLISTKKIDSCKYIVSPIRGKSHGLNIVHAGDCPNPVHK